MGKIGHNFSKRGERVVRSILVNAYMTANKDSKIKFSYKSHSCDSIQVKQSLKLSTVAPCHPARPR